MKKKPILITALSSIVAGVGTGLLAFFCLPITVPVAVVTGVVASTVLGCVNAVNALYIESEVRMEAEEQKASELEMRMEKKGNGKSYDDSLVDENSKSQQNNQSMEIILSKLNSMEIKQEQRDNENYHRYLDLKTTLSENRSRPDNNELNTHQEISPNAQSTGLQNHGLFPSANDAQVNQVPSATDTPNTTKKRPEFRNGAPKI